MSGFRVNQDLSPVTDQSCQSKYRLRILPTNSPTPTSKKPIRARRWFGNGFGLKRYVMVPGFKEARIAAAPTTSWMNVTNRFTRL